MSKQVYRGEATRERVKQTPNGITLPITANGPAYMNAPMRSKNAPNHAKASDLEKALDDHELYTLNKYLAAALTVHGKAKVSSYDGGSLSKGSKTEGELPFTDNEQHIIAWYSQLQNRLPWRSKCGLELLYRTYLGETNARLEDIGRVMTRCNDKRIIRGGVITFFRMVVQDIEEAEKQITHHQNIQRIMNKAVSAK